MKTGTVKWFSNAKGWGFINAEGSDEDIFVHYSVVKGTGFKTLKTGQTVSFELATGSKGLSASEVVILEAEMADDN